VCVYLIELIIIKYVNYNNLLLIFRIIMTGKGIAKEDVLNHLPLMGIPAGFEVMDSQLTAVNIPELTKILNLQGKIVMLEKPNSQQLIRRGGCDPVPLAFQTNNNSLFPNDSSRLNKNKRNMY